MHKEKEMGDWVHDSKGVVVHVIQQEKRKCMAVYQTSAFLQIKSHANTYRQNLAFTYSFILWSAAEYEQF